MSDKITTITGKEMLASVTPIYNDDEYALSIFEANGKIMEEMRVVVKEVRNQMYPHKATWSFEYWEDALGLSNEDNLNDEQRRNRIITKIRTYFPMTPYRMEQIASSAAGVPVKIVDFVSPYIFEIILGIGDSVNIGELIYQVNETKPAHLDFIITQQYKNKVYLSSAMLTGEEITVYPWSEKSIETVAKVKQG